MYDASLLTQDFAKSPLGGLLKIDQIAFLARNDQDEAAIKKQLRLTDAKWIEDEVVAAGYVRGAREAGQPRDVKHANKAKLLFNYDYGIEVEILRYLEGPNYGDVGNVTSCQVCHIGAHVEKGADIYSNVPFDFIVPAAIIQQVETQSHTNEYLLSIGRRYRYTIYDTKQLFGVYFKVIERIEK